MPMYQYKCMDSQGKTRSGQLEAPAEVDAQKELRAQGLFVTQLKKAAGHDEEPATAHVGRDSFGCSSASVVLFLLFLLSVGVVTLAR